MNPHVHPEHGGRVELRRGEPARNAPGEDSAPPSSAPSGSIPPASGAHVVYQAIWSTRAGAWRGEVTIEGNQVSLAVIDSSNADASPPTWLTDWTLQLVRTTLRSVALDPAAELPRRFTRWRAAPEER